VLDKYKQDSICGTWELLADAISPGGMKIVREKGWPLRGKLKHEWAQKIGLLMKPASNQSPSFDEFRHQLHRLVAVKDK
jgi:hypothetical protein